jgi:hypothetical protein
MDESDITTETETLPGKNRHDMLTITGKELPSGWPALSTSAQVNNAYLSIADIPDEERFSINHFSYNLRSEGHSLYYAATTHTPNPNHPQWQILSDEFTRIKPKVLLYEGPTNTWVAETKAESISKGGEAGFVSWLADTHNKNLSAEESIVVTRSLDLPFSELVVQLKENGYSNEDIGLLIISRWSFNLAEKAIEQKTDLVEAEKTFQRNFEDNTSNIMAELRLVPRHDGKEWTYERAKQEYQDKTGKVLTFATNNNQNQGDNYLSTLNGIVTTTNDLRDKHMIFTIASTVKEFGSVMAIAGSMHPIRQESALKELFDQPKTTN